MKDNYNQGSYRGFNVQNDIFSHALKYAERGYEVFPLAPGQKIPMPGSNGCKDATTDMAQIKRWIEEFPDANIGIKAGSDVIILDIDNKDGKNGSLDLAEIEKELGSLPECPKAETPTGGFHLYFRHPGVEVKGQAGVKWKYRETGIDIRVGNQYVLAPASIHPVTKTKYLWWNILVPKNDLPELPQTWIDEFLPKRDKEVVKVKPTTNPSATTKDTHSTVFPLVLNGEAEQQAVKYLDTCPKSVQERSGRNTLFATAIALVRGFKLEPQRAADISWEYYNFYCSPFWTDSERKEFDRAFFDATKANCLKSDGWLIKDVGGADKLAWEPFPIECYPPVLRNMCLACSKATNTDPAYPATFILPVVASAIGAHITAVVKRGWNPPPILWSLVVAPSGACKTHTLRPATKPLIEKQKEFSKQHDKAVELYEKEKTKYEADRFKSRKGNGDIPVKPEAPKRQFCYVSDTTTEMLIPILADNPYGVCSVYDEAMTFFGSLDCYRNAGGGGKDEGIYNEVYDGGYVQVTRKTGNQFIAAESSNCSITGGIQLETLKSILKRNPQFFHSGFLARFLLCMPPDIPKPINYDFIPEDVENTYNRLINTLFSWRKKAQSTPATPCRLPLTPVAKELFDEYHDELENERAALPSGIMKATLSKLKGYIMRIALTLHIADFASSYPNGKVPRRIPRIGEEAMQAAITIVKWFRREDQRILEVICPNEVLSGDKEITAILGHIQRREGRSTTARIVRQNINAFDCVGGSKMAEQKLEEMVTSGLLIHDGQLLKKRVYSLPSTTYADNPPAVPAETADFVGGCRRVVGEFVGMKNDAKLCENNGLEKVVGIVGGFGGVETEKAVEGNLGECETGENIAECSEEAPDTPEIDDVKDRRDKDDEDLERIMKSVGL